MEYSKVNVWLWLKGCRYVFATGVMCFMLLAFSFQPVSAQTFAEWWSQKKTQIRYLNQQIAALMVYGQYVKQGYQVSQNGLGSISGWAKDEFDLHRSRYSSLRQVNPAIKDDGRAVAVVNDLEAISLQLSGLGGVAGLKLDDREYLSSVRVKVLLECDAEVSELELVTTSAKAEMTDDERLARLAQIDERVKELLSFTAGFCSRVKALVLQREQAERDLKTMRRLYGID
jgi:hypothetical protein